MDDQGACRTLPDRDVRANPASCGPRPSEARSRMSQGRSHRWRGPAAMRGERLRLAQRMVKNAGDPVGKPGSHLVRVHRDRGDHSLVLARRATDGQRDEGTSTPTSTSPSNADRGRCHDLESRSVERRWGDRYGCQGPRRATAPQARRMASGPGSHEPRPASRSAWARLSEPSVYIVSIVRRRAPRLVSIPSFLQQPEPWARDRSTHGLDRRRESRRTTTGPTDAVPCAP